LFTAELAYAYTGKRFIQTDNKEYLPGFGLVQAEINYQKTIRNKVVLFRLEGDNLLNIQYQTVPNRPMPGASVRFTTTFRF
jgi:outer membrane cobalamin receptor